MTLSESLASLLPVLLGGVLGIAGTRWQATHKAKEERVERKLDLVLQICAACDTWAEEYGSLSDFALDGEEELPDSYLTARAALINLRRRSAMIFRSGPSAEALDDLWMNYDAIMGSGDRAAAWEAFDEAVEELPLVAGSEFSPQRWRIASVLSEVVAPMRAPRTGDRPPRSTRSRRR